MKITAIVLASGFSRRLGTDKLLLPIRGKAMIQWVLEEIAVSGVDRILVVYREEAVRQLAEEIGVEAVPNREAEQGMSSSIRAGVRAVADPDSAFMFFVGDQIFLQAHQIDRLIEEAVRNPDAIIIPRSGNRTGNPVIFPPRYRQRLMEVVGDEGGRQILRTLTEGKRYVDFPDAGFFRDIDTRDDVEAIERLFTSIHR